MIFPKYRWMILTSLLEDSGNAQRVSTYRVRKEGNTFSAEAVFRIPGWYYAGDPKNRDIDEFIGYGFSRREAKKECRKFAKFSAEMYKVDSSKPLEARVD